MSASGESRVTRVEVAERAIERAERLMDAAPQLSARERRSRGVMTSLLASPEALRVVVSLCDEVMRASPGEPFVRALRASVSAIPASGFSRGDRWGLRAVSLLASVAPRSAQRLVGWRVRDLADPMIGRAEVAPLRRHLERRAREGLALNINLLGEAVLGENEAVARRVGLREIIERREVEYVSVKLSALISQIVTLDDAGEVARASAVMRAVVAHARSHATFVNFDMEEYRDLHITLNAFEAVALDEELRDAAMGVVLQAYLPDSHAALRRLVALAADRRAAGGAPIKVRVVKGANLAMEHVEADTHGWAAAPYGSKAEVDASWVALTDAALAAAGPGLRVGVATHNTYDAAWAMELAAARGVRDHVDLEMLEGMANHEARAWAAEGVSVRLYAPVTTRDDFAAAVAYLVRRLDENTAPENYLRAAFFMDDPSVREHQRRRFLDSLSDADRVDERRRRGPGDRGAEVRNEPDADVSLPEVRAEVRAAVARALAASFEVLETGEESVDPSSGRVLRRRETAGLSEVRSTLAAARDARDEWPVSARRAAIESFAALAADERFDTAALMALETGKTFAEANAEVSEAVDFAREYARGAREDLTPFGVAVVTPPWNFPYAIPAGGVLAALAAGNRVILKPAPEARLVGEHLAGQLWRAGVPRERLHWCEAGDDEAGRALVEGADVVVLTGSRAAAELFYSWRADLRLLAETSGKNSLVITGRADYDLAVRDLVHSAFSHAGQKCSAASLAVITDDVRRDPRFWRQLRDAVTSLAVGPATEPGSVVGPIIRPPSAALARALESLDAGESWFIEPRRLAGGGNLWAPGVKVGVVPGSWSHLQEWFGPVLAVMCARDLEEAIAFQNATDYGLTAGIASLDVEEIETWLERVCAGNLYVNRTTTGAVVGRQPFGGWRASAMGPTTQAGQAAYVSVLGEPPALVDPVGARADLVRWMDEVGSRARPTDHLAHEVNVHRFRHYREVVVRVDAAPKEWVAHVEAVAGIVGAAVSWSSLSPVDSVLSTRVESAEELVERLGGDDALRWLSSESPPVVALARRGVRLDPRPLAQRGDDEGPRWVRPQSVSVTAHRWGNCAAGPRVEVPGLTPRR